MRIWVRFTKIRISEGKSKPAGILPSGSIFDEVKDTKKMDTAAGLAGFYKTKTGIRKIVCFIGFLEKIANFVLN